MKSCIATYQRLCTIREPPLSCSSGVKNKASQSAQLVAKFWLVPYMPLASSSSRPRVLRWCLYYSSCMAFSFGAPATAGAPAPAAATFSFGAPAGGAAPAFGAPAATPAPAGGGFSFGAPASSTAAIAGKQPQVAGQVGIASFLKKR